MTDKKNQESAESGPGSSGPGKRVTADANRGARAITCFEALSKRLKQVRQHLRKTQSGMDALLRLGKGSWQRYESGGQTPGSRVVARITTLGYNANWLLTGTGPMRLEPPVPEKVSESGSSYGPNAIDTHILRDVLEVIEPRLTGLDAAARADLIVELARWAQAQRDRERSDVLDELKRDVDMQQHERKE